MIPWFQYAAHLMILIDSVYRSDESFYHQAFLEKCKFKNKKKTIKRFITKDLADSDSKASSTLIYILMIYILIYILIYTFDM